MVNLITIKNTQPVITMNTLEQFSGHDEKSIQNVIRGNEKDLLEMSMSWEENYSQQDLSLPLHTNGTNKGKVNWLNVVFDEKQSMYLLTLLGNTKKVKAFKKQLVNEFFTMRTEIVSIEIKAIQENANKQILLVKEESRKYNDYSGYVTIGRYLQEENVHDYSKELIYKALTWKGISKDEEVKTIYRRIPQGTPEYLGKTISGSKGAPIYPPSVITGVVQEYEVQVLDKEEPSK